MKMLLTGPQAITIFPVAKDEAVPSSAKASSFATPQGYIVAETGNLYLYVKGQEYKFVDQEEYEKAAGSGVINAEPVAETIYASLTEFKDLTERVESLSVKVDTLDSTLFSPLKAAFAAVHNTESEVINNGK